MEKAIEIINEACEDGIFLSYAIGGGIATLFYIEPVATFDLDIFVILPENSGMLVSLSPVYAWFEKRGYKPQKEQIVIEGIPVQIIPVYNDLVKEGVINAVEKKYGDTSARVLRPEYLMGIMVQTFRPKDKERLIRFIEETDINPGLLDSVLSKFKLKKAFTVFKKNYS